MKRITRLLATAWGKVRRSPSLPQPSPTASEPAQHPAWDDYTALMASHPSYPGWTFCRFGVRGPTKDDHSEVQGIVRAPFGAWWSPFLCIEPETGYRASHGLACVEHTRTGLAIGVFANMDTAVEAAEIAMRMDAWHTFDLDQNLSLELIRRVRTAWTAAGITMAPFSGYPLVRGEVPEGMPPVGIFAKTPTDHHRPEKLS
ncbi:hypothetical protein ABIB86_000382 [Bradyrhizobium sp. JR1.7]|uniref:hypothetical protein n=1 Tax=unclassified Bradyrhizobium TaxID=2631580 RepID=UPI003391C9C7